MPDRTAARRVRSPSPEAKAADHKRLMQRLRRALRLLQESQNRRTNPEDDDEDPTRRAGARH